MNIAIASLNALPFMAGFYSNDFIMETHSHMWLLSVIALGFILSVIITPVYSLRLINNSNISSRSSEENTHNQSNVACLLTLLSVSGGSLLTSLPGSISAAFLSPIASLIIHLLVVSGGGAGALIIMSGGRNSLECLNTYSGNGIWNLIFFTPNISALSGKSSELLVTSSALHANKAITLLTRTLSSLHSSNWQRLSALVFLIALLLILIIF